MLEHEDPGTGGPPDEPDDQDWRDRRIEELRDELDELRARVGDDLARQRRVVMQLHALLEEKRHIARRTRPQEPVARRWQDGPGRAAPGESDGTTGYEATGKSDGTGKDDRATEGEKEKESEGGW